MTTLEWDKSGEHFFTAGVDRGVLLVHGDSPVAWNGLTSVEDGSDAERKAYYLDGIKYLESVVYGDYAGKLSAFTYPDEFEKVLGNAEITDGLFLHEQPITKQFNLSYRNRIGNDIEGEAFGYRIHLLYNLVAVPDSVSYGSLSDQVAAEAFSWTITGTPASTGPAIHARYKPTTHISIDSTKADPDSLQLLENLLYGTDTANPQFPTIYEVRAIFGEVGGLLIIDNGDGTWTAVDSSDDYISMIDADTFQIDFADVTYLDPDTYTITDTPLPLP